MNRNLETIHLNTTLRSDGFPRRLSGWELNFQDISNIPINQLIVVRMQQESPRV